MERVTLSLEQGTLETRLTATRFLLQRAHDLSVQARDESESLEVRVQAAAYARAVRAEGNLKQAGT